MAPGGSIAQQTRSRQRAPWWAELPEERYWLEATDRSDLGADLHAPLLDSKNRENWRYCLFRESTVGDVVYHYDTNVGAIVASSIIAGGPEPCRTEWVARGSSARGRGATIAEVDGYRIPLERTEFLTDPLRLEELRLSKELLTSVAAASPGPAGPRYFPFELSGRPVRPLQGYAFKLPAAFVGAFPKIARSDAESQADSEIPVPPDRIRDQAIPFDAPPVPSVQIYMMYLLPTLRAFGGAATSEEVYDWYIREGIARPGDLATIHAEGESRFRKQVRFARLALARVGLLSGNDPGQWRLSPLGWTTELDLEAVRAIANRRAVDLGGRQIQHPDPPESRVREGPTKGPAPVAWEGMVRRTLATEATTYAMRFGSTSIWKIGHTSNLTARLAELNRHVPTEVLNCRWFLVREQKSGDPRLAYEMEQRLLAELAEHRTTGERVNCTEDQLAAAWAASRP